MRTLLFSIFSFYAITMANTFPAWVNDNQAKIWTVNQLIEFMKEDKFYKIQKFEVKREFDEKNKSDALMVTLTFDDPNCKDRWVQVYALAKGCSENSCVLFNSLTDCMPGETSKKFFKRKVYR